MIPNVFFFFESSPAAVLIHVNMGESWSGKRQMAFFLLLFPCLRLEWQGIPWLILMWVSQRAPWGMPEPWRIGSRTGRSLPKNIQKPKNSGHELVFAGLLEDFLQVTLW